MRFATLALLLVSVFLGAFPASAQSTRLQGQLLTHPVTINATTGACSCLERWFTAGFRPGRVTIRAQLDKCAYRTYAVCTLNVYLLSGRSMAVVKQITLRCAKTCGHAVAAHVAISHAGVYHLMVHGEGASVIFFTMHVGGPMYRVRCGSC